MLPLRSSMKRIIVSIIAAATLLCVSSCQLAKLKRVRVAPEPVKVTVMVARQSADVSRRSYIGTVETSKDAVIEAVHGGTVKKINVVRGQRVAAGEILAEVYSPSIESSLKAAKASLKQARDGYDRANRVFSSGSISEMKMVEVETKLAQAQASLAAAQAAYDDCQIKAPFDGRISEMNVHCGEYVTINTPMFSIVDACGLEVVVSVPESEVAGIKQKSRALAVFPALGDVSVNAEIKDKGLVANNLSHAYRCTLRLLETPEDLMCGMVCKVYMASDMVHGIVIPADIVKVASFGKYVWIIDKSGRVNRRTITMGGYSGKGIVVTSGLYEGDVIILEGMDKVSVGMKVQTQEVKPEV